MPVNTRGNSGSISRLSEGETVGKHFVVSRDCG